MAKLHYFSVLLGLIFTVLALIVIVFLVISNIYTNYLNGWVSLIACLFLCTGIVLINLGIVGIYIGKIFNQVKNRPLYLIEKILKV